MSDLKSTLYVSGLDPAVTAQTLHDAFVPFGEIADITFPDDEPTEPSRHSTHKGFALVEFSLAEDALEAIDNMDQSKIFGRVVHVNIAKKNTHKAAIEGLNSRTALWEQEDYAERFVKDDPAPTATNMDAMQGLEALTEAGPHQQ
ncbi:RNA-binding domain-containing protein [Piedraia hortae CBS 480.64]|uniref:RNA-binding domain-containing protein n=1 Tax=Piedraia hortae CBS 480.64 TaxID=1314780 RepID=A0A6A7C531_9PEZI|nr:RNA-binding domain-containing protein [Piedraia hortae CBS 480.64]